MSISETEAARERTLSPFGLMIGRWVTQVLGRKDLWMLFMVAVLLRIIMYWLSVSQLGSGGLLETSTDTVNYVRAARGFAEDTGFDEKVIFGFGPGFPIFLALNFILFGVRSTPVIFVQILLSGIACLMLYRLAMELLHSRPTAMIAAMLAATSYTSITLSCLLLSDSVFYFLFLWGLLLFLKGLTSGSWTTCISSGILVGVAALTRPIGQFWPIAMIIIVLVGHFVFTDRLRQKSIHRFSTGIIKPVSAAVMAIVIISMWLVRNHSVHGVTAVAFTSAFGPVTIAAQTMSERRNVVYRELLQKWTEDYLKETNRESFTRGERFEFYMSKSREVFREQPWKMIKTYALECWTNLNAVCYYHRFLIPESNRKTAALEWKYRNLKLNYLSFLLSMVGFVILLTTHQYRAFVVLACIYVYFACLIGFFPWQGSRYFFPGQIASVTLMAVVFLNLSRGMRWCWMRVKLWAIARR